MLPENCAFLAFSQQQDCSYDRTAGLLHQRKCHSQIFSEHTIAFVSYHQTSGDSGANVKRLDVETKEKIATLQKEAQSKGPEVSITWPTVLRSCCRSHYSSMHTCGCRCDLSTSAHRCSSGTVSGFSFFNLELRCSLDLQYRYPSCRWLICF